MHDLIVRGGSVVDGTGAPARLLDVAVAKGRIVAVGRELGEAARVIDATGHVVAPGFIDIHTHSDYALPTNPRAESKIRQGVTTEVVGNCGYSVAPVPADRVAALRDYLAASGPWYDFRETSFARYVEEFPPTSVNVAFQVGHNTLRLIVAGMEPRPLRPDELTRMTRYLEEGLDAGAIGLSSGLFTPPGSFASAEEMRALGDVLRRHDAAYASHIRNEAGSVFDAVDEAIAVGERSGVHVQIGHLKVSGTENWGAAARLVERIEAARARGVRVDCDQYPYTTATNPLRNLLPPWIQEGGMEAMVARLGDKAVRTRVADEIAARGCGAFGRLPSWDAVRIALTVAHPEHAGRTIGEIATERGRDGLETLCDVLLADRGATRVVFESMAEDDVQTILGTPWVVIGSDGVAMAPYGPTAGGKPHPRYYGTFARVLGRYVRELKTLSLEAAVWKMTGGSAAALGLVDRGLVREGLAADLTVFDPATVGERGTYTDPHRYAAGIRTVVVNGAVVVDGAEHTGALPGRVLRRSARGLAA
ncbi:MAG TPA: D-aminoacylase [Methylomirabilota bacterium]|nr:D-aminoacylase [Methylomirabilota bacterium]